MAASRALRRLLRIREIEEEQRHVAVESAVAELKRLELAQAATAERDRQGRRLLASSAYSGELPDRLAALEESSAARRHSAHLASRIESAQREVENLRHQFLLKRVERRQAETLIGEEEGRVGIEEGRRSQQAIDDWHRFRLHRSRTESATGSTAITGFSVEGDERAPQKS
jgi:flagellar biosynthesis chaperone FliJ